MADAVSGEALDQAQKVWNEMREEPDSTGKIAVLAEALEAAEARAEAAAVAAGPTVLALPSGSVRVLRLIEYVYPHAGIMVADMDRWTLQGTLRTPDGKVMRSTVLPPEVLS